jgi:hypothetical protein
MDDPSTCGVGELCVKGLRAYRHADHYAKWGNISQHACVGYAGSAHPTMRAGSQQGPKNADCSQHGR